MEEEEEEQYYGAMSKTELAMLYAPDLKPYIARRRLNRWIRKNQPLWGELAAKGYTERLRMLTTAHVRLIVRFLGEP